MPQTVQVLRTSAFSLYAWRVKSRTSSGLMGLTPAIMSTLPWFLIPGFLVPLLFTVHIGIFVRLAKAKSPSLARS